MCFNMSKKSNLLKEIGNIVNKQCSEIDIHDLNFEILKALNTKMMNLDDSRHGSYELHYMNEIVIIVFLALLSNCDEWTQIYMFQVQHEEWLHNLLSVKHHSWQRKMSHSVFPGANSVHRRFLKVFLHHTR